LPIADCRLKSIEIALTSTIKAHLKAGTTGDSRPSVEPPPGWRRDATPFNHQSAIGNRQ
jgi:hypothetical protein